MKALNEYVPMALVLFVLKRFHIWTEKNSSERVKWWKNFYYVLITAGVNYVHNNFEENDLLAACYTVFVLLLACNDRRSI